MKIQSINCLSCIYKFPSILLAVIVSLFITACGSDSDVKPLVPFVPSPVFEYEPIFMVGGATSGGWALANKVELEHNSRSPGVYSWEGELKPGEIKFVNYFASDFCGGPWILATTEDEIPDLTGEGNLYIHAEDCPDESGADDFKWVITELAIYSITINTNSERIYFKLAEAIEYYSTLHLVGSAVSADGELTVDDSNPAVFSWAGELSVGEFKIAADLSLDDDHDWLLPAAADQSLVETGFSIASSADGEAEFTWQVTAEGTYRITVDLANETIHIGAPFINLFLVGGAAPGGWALGDAVSMERDASNVFLYTSTVELVEGELKIAAGTTAASLSFDPGYEWIQPNIQGQPLEETAFSIVEAGEGANDYKWEFAAEDAGTYLITLDLSEATIVFEKQGSEE